MRLINGNSPMGMSVSASLAGEDQKKLDAEKLRRQMNLLDIEERGHSKMTMMEFVRKGLRDSGFLPQQFVQLDHDILENVRALEIIGLTSQDSNGTRDTRSRSYLMDHRVELLNAYKRVQVKVNDVFDNMWTKDLISQIKSVRSDTH